jgi:dihydroorotate dehydrogenase
MSDWYEKVLRPLLFQLDPERAHNLGVASLRAALSSNAIRKRVSSSMACPELLPVERFGLKFANPLGVAAGFDKNGRIVAELAALGFGSVEVGTVTLEPQSGNEKPRLFRLERDRALINRLGFNNEGAAAIRERLDGLDPGCIVGVNIGKNRDVPPDDAAENYLATFELVHPAADYVAINVSSPNTPGLRDLQRPKQLANILGKLQDRNRELREKPVLVKIAPDLDERQLDEIVGVSEDAQIAGLIATNTTLARDGLLTKGAEKIAGGLSGRPLAKRSTDIISKVYRRSKGQMPIIGVGGIFSAEDALDKITAGASLLQLYTGFIYGGPTIAREICRGLAELLRERGFKSVDEAVGSDSGN